MAQINLHKEFRQARAVAQSVDRLKLLDCPITLVKFWQKSGIHRAGLKNSFYYSREMTKIYMKRQAALQT